MTKTEAHAPGLTLDKLAYEIDELEKAQAKETEARETSIGALVAMLLVLLATIGAVAYQAHGHTTHTRTILVEPERGPWYEIAPARIYEPAKEIAV